MIYTNMTMYMCLCVFQGAGMHLDNPAPGTVVDHTVTRRDLSVTFLHYSFSFTLTVFWVPSLFLCLYDDDFPCFFVRPRTHIIIPYLLSSYTVHYFSLQTERKLIEYQKIRMNNSSSLTIKESLRESTRVIGLTLVYYLIFPLN